MKKKPRLDKNALEKLPKTQKYTAIAIKKDGSPYKRTPRGRKTDVTYAMANTKTGVIHPLKIPPQRYTKTDFNALNITLRQSEKSLDRSYRDKSGAKIPTPAFVLFEELTNRTVKDKKGKTVKGDQGKPLRVRKFKFGRPQAKQYRPVYFKGGEKVRNIDNRFLQRDKFEYIRYKLEHEAFETVPDEYRVQNVNASGATVQDAIGGIQFPFTVQDLKKKNIQEISIYYQAILPDGEKVTGQVSVDDYANLSKDLSFSVRRAMAAGGWTVTRTAVLNRLAAEDPANEQYYRYVGGNKNRPYSELKQADSFQITMDLSLIPRPR